MESLFGMDAGFILVSIALFILIGLLIPYFSLLHLSDLSKLGDIAKELAEIRKELAKMREREHVCRNSTLETTFEVHADEVRIVDLEDESSK